MGQFIALKHQHIMMLQWRSQTEIYSFVLKQTLLFSKTLLAQKYL